MQEENESHGDNAANAKDNNTNFCNCLFAIYSYCSKDNIVILVIGLDDAGKSTLISTIRKEETHIETPIWGYEQKEWKTRAFQISLYDLGGGKSIRGLWPHYYSKAYGTIFVVDGANDYRLLEASTELKNAMRHPRLARKPFLVVANKLNEGSALHYDELMGALGPFNTNEQAFIYCDCRLQKGRTIHKDLQIGLDWLLAAIKFRFKELRERVAFETCKQADGERRSLIERRQRSKSYLEEKEAASRLPLAVLPNLKHCESSTHARMQNWVGPESPDGSSPVPCTYARRMGSQASVPITTADYEKSLQPLIQQYEQRTEGPAFTPSQIAEYFGDSIDHPADSNLVEIRPHLPGQAE